MASKATLSCHLQGVSDLKGAIGPRDFAADFTNAPQNFDDEMMVVVTQANGPAPANGVTVNIPPMTTMGMIIIFCDQTLQFVINSEAVTRTLSPPAAGSKGVFVFTGQPNITSLTFFGTAQSNPKATAYIFVIGS